MNEDLAQRLDRLGGVHRVVLDAFLIDHVTSGATNGNEREEEEELSHGQVVRAGSTPTRIGRLFCKFIGKIAGSRV